MATQFKSPPDLVEQWELDLREVGLVRRIVLARRWHGINWWLVAVSIVIVFAFMVLAAFPQWFAAYGPLEQVGPRLLAPRQVPARQLLIVAADSPYESISDFDTDERTPVAVMLHTPSSEVIRDAAEKASDEILASGGEGRIRLQIRRFGTLEETLDAVRADDASAAVVSAESFGAVADGFSELKIAGVVSGADEALTSFPLGTNQVGQDVLSRLIWGTRSAIMIGLSASIASFVVGVPLGLLSGMVGGKIDRAMALVMDSLYAFPGLILAIAITAVLGPSILNTIAAIAVLYIPTYFRIVRGQTLQAKAELYVEAARSLGATSSVIARRYIFPNVVPTVAVIFSVNVADAILTGASLSFLGLGLPPWTPDWGIDIARGQEFIRSAWWLITFPGLAVMLIVLAFTMMGEGLVEIFNPKLRER